MKRLLRYNTRHMLHFPGDGKMPKLNPLGYSSHAAKSRKRTRSFSEPLWLFRLRQRLFCYAGATTCDGHPATWDMGPDNNRTCSYCGSIHPDDLMKICRKVLADERYAVEGTTKSYKVYVRQPGVRNASEGAIKFYMNHVPENVGAADQKLFADAMLVSAKRWDAQFQRSRQAVAAE